MLERAGREARRPDWRSVIRHKRWPEPWVGCRITPTANPTYGTAWMNRGILVGTGESTEATARSSAETKLYVPENVRKDVLSTFSSQGRRIGGRRDEQGGRGDGEHTGMFTSRCGSWPAHRESNGARVGHGTGADRTRRRCPRTGDGGAGRLRRMALPIRGARARPTSMPRVSQELRSGTGRTDAARFEPGDERPGCRRRRPPAHRGQYRIGDQRPPFAAGRALRTAMQVPRTSVRSGCGACARADRPHRADSGPRPDALTSANTGPSAAGRRSPGASVLHAQWRRERIQVCGGRRTRGHALAFARALAGCEVRAADDRPSAVTMRPPPRRYAAPWRPRTPPSRAGG